MHQGLPLPLRVRTQWLVVVEQPGAGEQRPLHTPDVEQREEQGPGVEGLVPVEEAVQVELDGTAQPLAGGARAGRVVEGVRRRHARRRLARAGEQQADQRGDVRHRAHRGTGPAAEGPLVHHDRGRQVVDAVGLGLLVLGEAVADERREGLVELALGLHGDGVEDHRRLARPGHAGEHRDHPFRDGQADVLEVVRAGTGDDDAVLVTTGMVAHGGTPGRRCGPGPSRAAPAREGSERPRKVREGSGRSGKGRDQDRARAWSMPSARRSVSVAARGVRRASSAPFVTQSRTWLIAVA